jgi:hypothetical protein
MLVLLGAFVGLAAGGDAAGMAVLVGAGVGVAAGGAAGAGAVGGTAIARVGLAAGELSAATPPALHWHSSMSNAGMASTTVCRAGRRGSLGITITFQRRTFL